MPKLEYYLVSVMGGALFGWYMAEFSGAVIFASIGLMLAATRPEDKKQKKIDELEEDVEELKGELEQLKDETDY